jgi:hypothetical protein
MSDVSKYVVVCLDNALVAFELGSILEILAFGVFMENELLWFFKKSSLILTGEKYLAKLEVEKFAEFKFGLSFLDV